MPVPSHHSLYEVVTEMTRGKTNGGLSKLVIHLSTFINLWSAETQC